MWREWQDDRVSGLAAEVASFGLLSLFPMLLAVGLALGSAVVGAAMLAVLVLGPLLGTGRDVADALGFGSAFAVGWDLLRWPTALVVLLVWAATVFHVAPDRRAPWRAELPGAVLSAVAWALASAGLRAYLEVAGARNEVLGTLGGSVVVILWLYLLAVGLLLGGELNALLARRAAARPPP